MSKDSGKTFVAAQWDRGNGKTHVDHRVVWVDPLNSKHILSGNDGGSSETWDGGEHWKQSSTINAQQFYDVSVDNEQPYNIMGGTQDNGAWIGPSQNRNQYGMFGSDWLYLPTGDGFYVVRDWWNPEYIYYESQFGASSRMNLKTGQTQSLRANLTAAQLAAGEPPLRYQWNAPIVLSPHNPGIVFIASQYVWRSLSHGDTGTFVRISPDLTKADPVKLAESKKTNLQWATIYSFSESPKKPGLYWAGTDDGNVWVTPDGGDKWTSITDQFYDGRLQAEGGREGRPHPVRPLGEARRRVGVRREHRLRRVQRLPDAQRGQDLAVRHQGPRQDLDEHLGRDEQPDLRRRGGSRERQRALPGHRLRHLRDDRPGQDVDGVLDLDDAADDHPRPGHPEARPRNGDRHLRARLLRDRHRPDQGVQARRSSTNGHLFDPKATIKWQRFERRGDTLGEMAKADNPPVGANLYYYLKADAQKVTLTIKDLEGNTIAELSQSSAEALRPSVKKGLQKVFWGLNRVAAGAPAGGGQRGAGGGGGGSAASAATRWTRASTR